MNRIYQGRVSAVELADGKDFKPLDPDPEIARRRGEEMLWQHHEVFQDAVNYYVVCLLALASGETKETDDIVHLRERMTRRPEDANQEEGRYFVWSSFRRRGAWRPGLRDSVAKYLTPGNDAPTFEECRAGLLAGNSHADTEEGRKLLDRGLAQLLSKCKGASGCQQAAPVFLPRFAKSSYRGNYGDDDTTLAREDAAARLPFILHRTAHFDSPDFDEFGVHSIALPNDKKPKFVGEEAKTKLQGMLAEWRTVQQDSAGDWKRLQTKIEGLSTDVEIPGYAATSAKSSDVLVQNKKLRLFGMFLFRYVERSDFTLRLLRSTTKAPEAKQAIPAKAETTAGSGDPIRLARGTRGYVFRAFTGLPIWGAEANGAPNWIEFDFAAFEEALKVIHQVEAKGDEREKEREKKEKRHALQREPKSGRKGAVGGEGEESERPPVLAGDPRITRVEQLVDHDLKLEYEMSEGVEVKYGLHPRTIRGFRDLRKIWNDALKPEEVYSEALRTKLWNKLTEYKKENAETIGSPVLFDELVKEENWIIWREPTAEQMAEWRHAASLPNDAEFANEPLQALTDERELLSDIERLKLPVRLTPADAEHSRRQFYFSDVTDLTKKRRLRHDQRYLDCEIAAIRDGKLGKTWARVHFSAPRLLRDQLNSSDGKDAAFQQAMMSALGLSGSLKKSVKGRSCDATFDECAAVALMPELNPTPAERQSLDRSAKENPRTLPAQRAAAAKRILLNFPITLEDDAVARALGKAARWDPLQFGGADGESYWLRWPGTWIDEKKERKKAPPSPWWRAGASFTCLSVDLGQRDAGAFALLRATPGDAPKPQSRKLGVAEDKTWWATVRATGMLRLPGEDAKVFRDGKWQEELSGGRGRLASEAEWEEARDICRNLGFDSAKLLGSDTKRYSFPELNDRLLYGLRRAQGRLARLQSWSSIAHIPDEEKKREAFEKRRKRIGEQLADAIESYISDEVKPDAERGQEMSERRAWLKEIAPHLAKQALSVIAVRIETEIKAERAIIQRELLRIADRVQPLRGRRWEWVPREDGGGCNVLRQMPRCSDARKKLIAGQRGLSLARIAQLDSLRQRCQSLNRALMQEPGKPANLGRSKRGIELPDPCPDLLDRLDALKEQRVNQTAHLILAQALGVRLKTHTTDAATREAHDIHGEYERIPGREPVDFIIIENLKYYEMTQGRSRSENARLMKWCRRHLRDKLIELCEPYGLRVVEEWPADTSKFCSLTGVAGFRAVELNPDDCQDFRWRKHLDRLADPARAARLDRAQRAESERVRNLFVSLRKLNADLLLQRRARPKWRTLLAPAAGGPIFVPMRGYPVQADINAAINLGLRALAAPDAEDIHLRIRAKRDGEKFVVRAENKREKARWGAKAPAVEISDEADRKKLLAEAHVNFFLDRGNVATFDGATITGTPLSIVSGRGLWGTINQQDWKRVEEINHTRIEKWEQLRDEADAIPM